MKELLRYFLECWMKEKMFIYRIRVYISFIILAAVVVFVIKHIVGSSFDPIAEIRQAVWEVHILRFFVGAAAICISFTRSRIVWPGYPTWLQWLLRPVSFLAGAAMIWSLTLP